MPTLIDSFLVEVGLDPKGYEKGSRDVGASFDKTKESARTAAKDMESYGKQSAAFFGKLKTEALGLFLAFAGASSIKGFVSDLLDGDASAGRLAKNLGVATQSVSAYRMVVRSLGGEAGDADATLSLLAQSRESLRLTGTTGHDAELMRLGVTKDDLEDPMKALDRIAKTGETMKREDYFAVLQRLGIPQGAVESLSHGKRGLDDLVAAKKRDGAATDEDAAKAQQFQAALVDLENKITGALRPSVYQLITGLSGLVDQFQAGKIHLSDYTPEIVALGVAAAVVGAPVLALGAALLAIAMNYDKIRMALRHLREETSGFRRGVNSWLDPINRALGLQTGEEAAAEAKRSDDDYAAHRNDGTSFGAAGGGGGGGGAVPAHLASRKAYIAAFWRSRGYSAEQANGIVAAMQAENSDLNYRARNRVSAGRHHAYGFGQWVSADRRNAFRARYGHEVEASSYQEQLDFMDWELKHGQGGAGVRGARSAHAAMEATVRGFYRPGAGTAGDLQRGGRALGERTVSIGTINVNAPNANPQAVADKVPAAINARLQLSQGNQALLG